MFEGYSADTGAGKFPLVLMGGRAEGPTCADPGGRTSIGASGIFSTFLAQKKALADFSQTKYGRFGPKGPPIKEIMEQ